MIALASHPGHQRGKFALLMLCVTALVFVVSALATTRILRGVSEAEVPNLAGKNMESARSLLRLKRLEVEIADIRFDARVPANIIIGQDPAPATVVKSGRVIHVIVSRGAEAVTVPRVADLGLRDATLDLARVGLNPGWISRMYSDRAPRDQVLDQWPPFQRKINPGTRVNLLVSAGPRPVRWIMPNLKGGSLAQASQVLAAMGMELQSIKRLVDPRYPMATVLDQLPHQGERVESGGSAEIVASLPSGQGQPSRRLITVAYHVPAGDSEVRVKIVVRDDEGLREIYNSMERPDADVSLRATVLGPEAMLTISINGRIVEERRP